MTNMIFVIRINILCLQTVLIKQPSPAAQDGGLEPRTSGFQHQRPKPLGHAASFSALISHEIMYFINNQNVRILLLLLLL